MFNVCPSCGIYTVDKEIIPGHGWHAVAICSDCGYAHPFLRLPLFIVSGASGTGKTALALVLSGRDTSFVHLESDILWRREFSNPNDGYREYREMWLRLAKNIGQAGRPVFLYGSVTPDQFEACLERRYFSRVYTLAFVCQPEILVDRLRARPRWRNTESAEFIQSMLSFNSWFIEHASADITVLDTSCVPITKTAEAVLQWAGSRWNLPHNERV